MDEVMYLFFALVSIPGPMILVKIPCAIKIVWPQLRTRDPWSMTV